MAVAVGYLSSTAYLILRDDLFNAALARQANLQHAYEDRIATLRGQVDRITSHRLLDQRFMENKIAELASRQTVLAQRSELLGPVLQKAKSLGINPATSNQLPVPNLRPGTEKSARKSASFLPGVDMTTTASIAHAQVVDELPAITRLAEVKNELSTIEKAQIKQVSFMTDAVYEKRNELLQTARQSGLPVKMPVTTGTGGPYIPADISNLRELFEHEVTAFQNAVAKLDHTQKTIKSFPITHPAPGKSISSGFGNRKDPLIGSRAFHAGMDFRAEMGAPIQAAGDGIVVTAGRSGGYGNLVEIKHANGLLTRYAHLSKINVTVGQSIVAGTKVGAAGSTGRSTGPHLHYEVRSNGAPVNPLDYLKAGARLGDKL